MKTAAIDKQQLRRQRRFSTYWDTPVTFCVIFFPEQNVSWQDAHYLSKTSPKG